MSDRRPAIPVVNTGNKNADEVLNALKTNVESMTGQNKNSPRLQVLAEGATLEQQRQVLNAIVRRLQGGA